jgi:hypothetical protein
MATKVKTAVLWVVTPCSLQVLLVHSLSQISCCDVMGISVAQRPFYLVLNTKKIARNLSLSRQSCQVGCEAVLLVQPFPALRMTIISSYSGLSSPRSGSLTLQRKEFLCSETSVTVYRST